MNYVPKEIVVLRVVDTGETEQITEGAPAKTHMKPDQVLIVIDDEERRIWIWKGAEAPVRRKFIAARAASGIRDQRGLTYKICSEDHGQEEKDFIEIMGYAPKTQPESIAGPPPPISIPPPSEGEAVRLPAPKTSPTDYTQAVVSATRVPQRQPVRVPRPTSGIIQQVEQLEPVPGFRREFVLIGFDAFGITEESTTVLGKRTISRKLQRIDSLPEGTIFAQGYTPRVVIKDGLVLAIEFLKKSEEEEYVHERPETKEEMRRQIADLIQTTQAEKDQDSEEKTD